ncbi:MAG: radical SAM protein [Thermoleophilia bacterium]
MWTRLAAKRAPLSFQLELTARCNNDCRHCYINLPAGDLAARARELTAEEIFRIADQAVEMGAVWCLLTGGEPLLRADFAEIYLGLKQRGLLLSLFTNACLLAPEHVALLRRHPPRDVEVSVYGASREAYERVTRRRGSFAAFTRGLNLLLDGGVDVRLKAVAMRSNIDEFPAIAAFCRDRTKDYYRFDPLLHLRYDRDPERNAEIRAERLTPAEIVAVERADGERFGALTSVGVEGARTANDGSPRENDHLFHCGAGTSSFTVGADGMLRLCGALVHPGTTYNLRAGSLREAWQEFVPRVRDLRGTNQLFLQRCRQCDIIDLCQWCPAHADLESGAMDEWADYFCAVAHARAAALAVPLA